MSKLYRYILGVDLGIASVGTALMQLDNNNQPKGILDLGVRIFDTPEGAADRRAKRQTRKTIKRRRARLKELVSFLQQNGLLPLNANELRAVKHYSPYRTRAQGTKQKYGSLYELGRSMLHIAKFRGASFLTQLAESSEDEDASASDKKDRQKSADAYRNIEKRLQNNGQSLSEYFYDRLTNKRIPVRRRKRFVEENLVDYAVPRFLVKEDFHRIWNKQAEFYSELTPEIKAEVYRIIFSEHPHAPYAVGKCTLDPDSGERRLPKMHRLSELRRIYEQVNNIRLLMPGGLLPLDKPQRDLLVKEAQKGHSLGKKSVKELLIPITDEKIQGVNLSDDEKAIKGYAHVAAFDGVTSWEQMSQTEQDDLIDFIAEPRLEPNNVNSRLMPEDDYLAAVARRLGFEGEKAADQAAKVIGKLPKDHSMLGRTACEKVLEKLIEGQIVSKKNGATVWEPHSNRTAADCCGYTAEEEKHRKIAGTYSCLPYYGEILRHDVAEVHPWHKTAAGEEDFDPHANLSHKRSTDANEAKYGRIPNPVVHVALNQLRKVVNEIISIYGTPQEIHVELSRDLGKSKKKRDEETRRNAQRKKENENIGEELRKYGLKPSGTNILKYKLWKEQNGIDIYNLQPIDIKTDFARCEIDHLIPQSYGGSDTYMNMALTRSNSNLGKGDAFPYDFIAQNNPDVLQHIQTFINDKKKYPPAKSWRFQSDAKEKYLSMGDEEQTDHRLNDTRYIAKMSARYLSAVCKDVICLNGGVTAKLRHLWGLDAMEYELLGLPTPPKVFVNDETGEVARNKDWQAKPRYDHRHHALDAIVAAGTTRSIVQIISRAERLGRGREITELPLPFGDLTEIFRQKVLAALRDVKVSPKAEHGKQGKLHDETKYRVLEERKNKPGNYLIRYKRPLSILDSKAKVQGIIFNTNTIPLDSELTKNVFNFSKKQITAIESRYFRAEESLKERNDVYALEGKKVTKIEEKHIVQEAIRLAKQEDPEIGHHFVDLNYKRLVGIRPKEQCGFEPNSNLYMDFYETQGGKVGWECAVRFNANQPNYVPEWKKDGHKFIWRVYNGDVLELNVTPELKEKYKIPAAIGNVSFTVQNMAGGSGTLMVCNLLFDARALSPKEGEGLPRWTSGNTGLTFFAQAKARKVELTPFGKIARKHKRLWHGKKAEKE